MDKNKLSKLIKVTREEMGINLETLSVSTKIPAKYIEAIENEKYGDIPPGPYGNLYIKTLMKELGIDEKNDVALPENSKEESVTKSASVSVPVASVKDKKTVKEDVPDDDSASEEEESGSSVVGIVVLFVIVCIALFAYFKLDAGGEPAPAITVENTTADSLSLVKKERELFIKDSIEVAKVKHDSLAAYLNAFKEDSITRSVDSETLEKESGWLEPPYRELSQQIVDSKYSDRANPRLRIIAKRGYVKLKYFSKEDKWWKRINYGDTLDLNLHRAATVHIYNANEADISYKGDHIPSKEYRFAKYLFTLNSSYRLQKVYKKVKE